MLRVDEILARQSASDEQLRQRTRRALWVPTGTILVGLALLVIGRAADWDVYAQGFLMGAGIATAFIGIAGLVIATLALHAGARADVELGNVALSNAERMIKEALEKRAPAGLPRNRQDTETNTRDSSNADRRRPDPA